METKVCSRCETPNPLSEYRKSKSNNDGLDGVCKTCRKKHEAEYRLKHKDRIHQNYKRFMSNNKEHTRLYNEEYRKLEKYQNYQKEYYNQNKERASELGKIWREKNKESLKVARQTDEHKAKRKVWRKNQNKSAKAYAKEYNKRPEVLERRRKEDKKRNQEPQRKMLRRYYSSQRKKRIRQATPNWLSKDDKQQIKNLHAYTFMTTEFSGIDHHVDHIIPIKGELVSGLNVPWNLQIIDGTSNIRKHNKFDGTRDNNGWKHD